MGQNPTEPQHTCYLFSARQRSSSFNCKIRWFFRSRRFKYICTHAYTYTHFLKHNHFRCGTQLTSKWFAQLLCIHWEIFAKIFWKLKVEHFWVQFFTQIIFLYLWKIQIRPWAFPTLFHCQCLQKPIQHICLSEDEAD